MTDRPVEEKQKYISVESRKLYEPGRIEDALLRFVQNEWDMARGISARIHDDYRKIRKMRAGKYVIDPEDCSPYADWYQPKLRRDNDSYVGLMANALHPDPQAFKEIKLRSASMLDKEVLDEVEGLDQRGIDVAWTVAFRQVLADSNYMETLKQGIDTYKSYGQVLMTVDPVYEKTWVPAEGLNLRAKGVDIETDSIIYDHPLARWTQDETGRRYQEVPVDKFQDLHFSVWNPMNVLVGDLECDGGVSALDAVWFYSRRSWRKLVDGRLLFAGKERLAGSYANLECLRPIDEDAVSDEHYADGFHNDEGYLTSASEKVRSEYGFQIRMGVMRWHLEDIVELREMPPTKAEWREFREKFGLTEEDLRTGGRFLVEWAERPRVLVRVERIVQPAQLGDTPPFVEGRYFVERGETIGSGDYQLGGGVAEVIYNRGIAHEIRLSERIADPPMWVDMSAVHPQHRALFNDTIPYFRGGFALKLARMTGTSPMGEMIPSRRSVESTRNLSGLMSDQLRQISGVSEQVLQGDGGADSATEANNQRDYLAQQLFNHQTRIEDQIVLPLLARAVYLMLDAIGSEGGLVFDAMNEELEEFGEMFREDNLVTFGLRADMISDKYRVSITTASANGTKHQQALNYEKYTQMALNARPVVQDQGKDLNGIMMLKHYAHILNVPADQLFREITPHGEQLKQQMVADAGPAGGGNPGGAGQARPDYQRAVPEMASPGERGTGVEPGAAALMQMMEAQGG